MAQCGVVVEGELRALHSFFFPVFHPLPTLFLASFHEFLKIHQCEVRRAREMC